MGTNKSRSEKIEWMIMMKNKIKPDELLLRTFCVRFSSTMHTAREIYNIVKDQQLLDRKLK